MYGCDVHGTPAGGPVNNSLVQSKTDQGRHDQLLEEIFLVGAVPLAIAGGYFLYKGYLDSGSEPTDGANGTTTAHGLRIFPTASASAGGIVTEFDF
jgi:hypothetical protein